MSREEHTPASGVTVGRVDNDQDTQQRVIWEHLQWLKKQIIPLLMKVGCREAELGKLKDEGRKLVERAHAALLLLGKTNKEAQEEIAQWRL